jgi:hypothetical protein
VINSLKNLNEAISKGEYLSNLLNSEISLIYAKDQELFDFDITNFNVENANEIREYILKTLKEKNLNWVVLAYEDDIIDNVNLQIKKQKIDLTLTDIKSAEIISELEGYVLYNFSEKKKALIVLDEFLELNLELIKQITTNLEAILSMEFLIIEPSFDIMQPLEIDFEIEEEIINETKNRFLNWAKDNNIKAKFYVGGCEHEEVLLEVKNSPLLITNCKNIIDLALNENKSLLKV